MRSLESFTQQFTRIFPKPQALGPLALWLALTLPVLAENTVPSSQSVFREVIQSAFTFNPQIQAAEAAWQGSLEKNQQAKAVLFPSIRVDGAKSHVSVEQNRGRVDQNPTTLHLTVEQPLLNAQAFQAYQQTEPYILAFEKDLAATRQAVLLAVSESVIQYLQAEDLVNLAKNNLEVTQRHLESTQARYHVGEITATDVKQAEARLASAKAGLIQRESDSAVSRARFQELTGQEIPAGLSLPMLKSDLFEQPLTELIPKVESRPDLEATKARLQVAEKAIDVEQAAHIPKVTLTGRTGRTWNDPDRPDPADDYSLTLGVSASIFEGGMVVSRTEEARSQRDMRQAELDRVRNQAVRELTQAHREYQSAQASQTAMEVAVHAEEEALRGIEQEFQVGTRTALDLLDAQRSHFTAQTDLSRSRYAVRLGQFRLLSAIGQLTLAAIQP